MPHGACACVRQCWRRVAVAVESVVVHLSRVLLGTKRLIYKSRLLLSRFCVDILVAVTAKRCPQQQATSLRLSACWWCVLGDAKHTATCVDGSTHGPIVSSVSKHAYPLWTCPPAQSCLCACSAQAHQLPYRVDCSFCGWRSRLNAPPRYKMAEVAVSGNIPYATTLLSDGCIPPSSTQGENVVELEGLRFRRAGRGSRGCPDRCRRHFVLPCTDGGDSCRPKGAIR